MKVSSRTHTPANQVENIPPLPLVVRYFDNFSHSYGQLLEPSLTDEWLLRFDGRNVRFNFSAFEQPLRSLVKSWCAFVLAELSPVTAYKYVKDLQLVSSETVSEVASSNPQEIRAIWKRLHAAEYDYPAFPALKSLLQFECRFGIGRWKPDSADIVSQLPLPKVDKYRSVRVGDAFLSTTEEAAIVSHIDAVAERLRLDDGELSDAVLQLTGMLICNYQFGLRAKQIAMLEMRGVTIWEDGLDVFPAVHLKFKIIKQRSGKKVFPMVRRVKREWSPIIVEVYKRAKSQGRSGGDHLFQRTPVEVWQGLGQLFEGLLQNRRTTTDLRHTAAQRLVDAGASEEELAAFMGHSDLDTGLIYFSSSRSQGERVNKALGISNVYQQVARIAHSAFISPEELIHLKGEQQIAGVPHGIPIAGIGGCTNGQPACPYNSVLSCYGCSRFMPVTEAGVHLQVLEDLRGVLKVFYAASRAERGSPAFQIATTIDKVQAVINELGGQPNELLS